MMWIFSIIEVLHVILCLMLIVLVLLQSGKGGGMGVAFGGGGSNNMFSSSGAGNFVSHLTTIVAAFFMIGSMSLSWASSRAGSDRLKDASKDIKTVNQALNEELGGESVDATGVDKVKTDLQNEMEDKDTDNTDQDGKLPTGDTKTATPVNTQKTEDASANATEQPETEDASANATEQPAQNSPTEQPGSAQNKPLSNTAAPVKKAAPKKVAPVKTTPVKKAAPQKAAPVKKATPKKAAPKKKQPATKKTDK
ncbi:MAG: preprotein translocase subunit SecG [Deltaproteobacteria bacterium]|jgi:preprotein translocase subunit SecG|nr:preprotein translocase subunit SecG [Deltaproteobacteria bacterium]